MASGPSVVGAICAVVMALVGLFREWRKGLSDGRADAKRRIDAVQEALNLALEEGRVSDAQRLQEDLRRLWDEYRRMVPAVVAAALLCSGCLHGGTEQDIVVGDRISVVRPGTTVVVPDPVPPARTWYLMDDLAVRAVTGVDMAVYGIRAPIAVGERLFVVGAGAEVEVPDPLPPATTWYLMDNVGVMSIIERDVGIPHLR